MNLHSRDRELKRHRHYQLLRYYYINLTKFLYWWDLRAFPSLASDRLFKQLDNNLRQFLSGSEGEAWGPNHCAPAIGFTFRKGEFLDFSLLFFSFWYLTDYWNLYFYLGLWVNVYLTFFSDWYCICSPWSYWIHQVPPWSSRCMFHYFLPFFFLYKTWSVNPTILFNIRWR